MDKKQTSPDLLQAELLPTQEEQVPANPPSRKRQLDSDDDAEPRTKRVWTTRLTSEPARLTRQNLARLNKLGNNYKGSKKGSIHRDSTTESSSTETLSTTASEFATQARENGILDPFSSKPPMNLEEIHRRLARTRATASPPESAYEDYAHTVGTAPNEATIVIEASGRLLKEYPRKGYKKVFKQAFTGYPKDVGFNNGLSAPQPDFIEGVEAEEYRPFLIDRHVRGAVLYKDNPHSITLPHIAGEWTGPDGSMAEARMQAAYDGAALVYARNQALDAAKEPYLAGHAKVTTFTTDGNNLNLFAHYAAETEDGTLEYHQYLIKSLSLMDSHAGYKEGRKQLRNAQDLAREESYALRDELKDYWRQPRDSLHPIAEGVPPLSVPDLEPLDTTHAYEDEDDYEVVEPQPVYQPTPPTSSRPKHSKSHHSHSTPNLSKGPPSTHSSTHGSGQKRKALSSQGSSSGSSYHSKYKSYWKKDAMSGRYYHKHSNGTVSWLDDDEEDERD
ncbi:hypothetical protein CEP52_016691 [Fusarium oligoseptatum]|uniref:Uncharacterized protein n=1 Tax=Fusarium oligoseptatum TaxID=2604345 RepID=A0A428S1A8_9HYPO|nr:hypothetical protein CEP52_016691 [Fusarium oligoseptatum]